MAFAQDVDACDRRLIADARHKEAVMAVLRTIFLLVAALCWINALIIAANGAVMGGNSAVLLISLAVASIYALIGLLIFFTQLYLLRARRQARDADVPLRQLTLCLMVGAVGLGLVMLLSLLAITERIGEGMAIFG
jgi:membrane protein YdbS with pleckstrin-like domain